MSNSNITYYSPEQYREERAKKRQEERLALEKQKRDEQRQRNQERLRKTLEEWASKRRKMKEMCKYYSRLAIYEMTDAETRDFAKRQAMDALESLRIFDETSWNNRRKITTDEANQFAAAILTSIHFFNDRSDEHKRAMLYREECRRATEAAARQREEQQKKSDAIVIHVL